jgi:hypothetical protein
LLKILKRFEYGKNARLILAGNMLTLDDLIALSAAYRSGSAISPADVLDRIGKPQPEEIGEAALQNAQSSDRNVRVLAMRLLAHFASEKTKGAIVAGLSDEKRRVRRAAVQASLAYLKYPEVVGRLQEMLADEKEVRKIRSAALSMLSGGSGTVVTEALPEAAATALAEIVKGDGYRKQVLLGLLRLDLTPAVEDLIRDFVKDGSKEEAVMATRGLCGYKVVNLGDFADEAERKLISQSCEVAVGRVLYWVRREDVGHFRK